MTKKKGHQKFWEVDENVLEISGKICPPPVSEVLDPLVPWTLYDNGTNSSWDEQPLGRTFGGTNCPGTNRSNEIGSRNDSCGTLELTSLNSYNPQDIDLHVHRNMGNMALKV